MISKKKQEVLREEARRWSTGELSPKDWEDAPEAVPRAGESISVSIRVPKRQLAILKEFARRQGVGYQVLMKKWLDDRIRQEAEVIRSGTLNGAKEGDPLTDVRAEVRRQAAA